MRDFHNAVGQYTNYRFLLEEQELDRTLFLAIPKAVYTRKFHIPGVQMICQKATVNLLIFNEDTEEIELWERQSSTNRLS